MKKTAWYVALGVCAVALLFIGCGPPDDEHKGFYCPSNNETVTWASYGNVPIKHFGPDNWGWKLESDCGWKVYEGHRGGYGDTLRLSAYNDGVIFIWAWQTFYGFRLSSGWTGQTEKGIKIGDTVAHFLYAYPSFRHGSTIGNQVYYVNDEPYVGAIFEGGILTELRVGW